MGEGKLFNNKSNDEPKAPVAEVPKEETKKVKATKPYTKKDNKGNIVTDKWGNPTFF